jgi:hypothetical protein
MSVTACPTKASSLAWSIGFVSVVVMPVSRLSDSQRKPARESYGAASVPDTESAESVAATDAGAAARAAPWTGTRRSD